MHGPPYARPRLLRDLLRQAPWGARGGPLVGWGIGAGRVGAVGPRGLGH